MPTKKVRSRRLVIDSDVVATATGNENPRSSRCLELLTTVRQTGHQVVLTPALATEWYNRFPKFAGRWLVQMKSEGLLKEEAQEPDTGVAGALRNLAVHPDILAIMLKDKHLLEAALLGDKTVFSMDEKAYYHFCDAAGSISRIRPVMWANPERTSDECLAWLRGGARPETKRRIGIRPRRGTG